MARSTTRCPTCRGPSTKDGSPLAKKLFPFCSERCQLVDLGRWLDESYRVPGEPADGVADIADVEDKRREH